MSVWREGNALSDGHYPKILARLLMLRFADGGDTQALSLLRTQVGTRGERDEDKRPFSKRTLVPPFRKIKRLARHSGSGRR